MFGACGLITLITAHCWVPLCAIWCTSESEQTYDFNDIELNIVLGK